MLTNELRKRGLTVSSIGYIVSSEERKEIEEKIADSV